MALTRLGPNQSINLASNVTGTLPAGNGGTGATSFSPGKVLQVLNKRDGTYQATSGSAFVDTSLQQAITTSSTSSKIIIMVEQKAVKASGNTGVKLRINRGLNEANVLAQFQTIGGETEEGTRNDFGSSAFFYLDSPNTTSSITYVTSFANYVSGTGAARVNNSSSDESSMVLMEISA